VKIERHPKFKKSFKKRVAPNTKLVLRFKQRLNIFVANPRSPVLYDHQLKGTKYRYRAFSITGDIRVIYEKVSDDHIILMDIGSHNQVY
jgi:addiction module RelE/StbE family toxin